MTLGNLSKLFRGEQSLLRVLLLNSNEYADEKAGWRRRINRGIHEGGELNKQMRFTERRCTDQF